MISRLFHIPAHLASVCMFAFIGLLVMPQAVQGGWIIAGETIPAGQVVDNDVVLAGTDVVMDGTVNGDVIAIGSTVTINGTVNGSLVALAQTVAINGQVTGSVYAGGRVLTLGSNSVVNRNVHFGGLLLDSRAGSKIGRDLVVGSLRGQISGEVGRALNAVILVLQFGGKIGYPIQDSLDQLQGSIPTGSGMGGLGSDASALDDALLFVSVGNHRAVGFAAPARTTLTSIIAQQPADPPADGPPDWLVNRLGDLVALLLVGGLAVWLIPHVLDRCVVALRAKPLPSAGLGALALLIFLNGFIVALVVGGVIVAIGLWLGSINQWQLALLFWGVAFAAVVLAFSVFALVVLYGSKVIVAYLVGEQILKRFYPRAAKVRFVILLLGVVLFVLLRSIPYLGWAVEVVVVVLGLGSVWLAMRRQPAAAVPTAAEAV